MLGFIGTGMMGGAMAQNLLKAGFELMVYDIRAESARSAVSAGAKMARTPSEMSACDVIFIMVNRFDQVEDVVKGRNGLLPGKTGEMPLRIVIMSTVSPSEVQNLAIQLRPFGVRMVDAPVSGGPVKAQEGHLSFMLGGEKEDIDYIKPYLQAMGKSISHIGPLGSGLATKLVNNVMTLSALYIIPEALKLGIKGGLDIGTMVEVFRNSTSNNWHFDHWSAYVSLLGMLLEHPRHLETLNLIAVKDLQTALDWAKELGYEAAVLKGILSVVRIGVESNGLVSPELFRKMHEAEVKDKE